MKLYPYSDLHELNLDWVLEKVKEAEGMSDEIEEAIETAGAAEEAANNAAQAAQQATNLVQEAMEQIGSKASLDYVDQAVRTSSDFLSESINAVAAEVDGKLDATKTALADTGALTTLSSAPASARIVGINAGNRQFSISLGSGLSLSSSNVLSATGGGEGGDVPTPGEADAGKVLTVNAGGIGFDWATPTGGNAVQKVTANNIVYGRILNEETPLPIATSSADANSIARRGTGGVLVVGTPSANNHATTKAYVDSAFNAAKPATIVLDAQTSTYTITGGSFGDLRWSMTNSSMSRYCVTNSLPYPGRMSAVVEVLDNLQLTSENTIKVYFYMDGNITSVTLDSEGNYTNL